VKRPTNGSKSEQISPLGRIETPSSDVDAGVNNIHGWHQSILFPSIQHLLENNHRLSDPKILEECGILTDCRVLLVNANIQRSLEQVAWFEAMGAEVAPTTDLDLAMDAIADNPFAWGLLVVEVDQLADEETVVGTLLLVRAVNPGLPVILASKYLHCEKCFADHTAICDVSLKGPLSKLSIRPAVHAAIENNRSLSRF